MKNIQQAFFSISRQMPKTWISAHNTHIAKGPHFEQKRTVEVTWVTDRQRLRDLWVPQCMLPMVPDAMPSMPMSLKEGVCQILLSKFLAFSRFSLAISTKFPDHHIAL